MFIRNNDVHHEFRQSSDLYYLAGFEEPRSVLVLRGGATGEFTLFVQPKDPEREAWDGPRAGVEGAKADFGADAAYPIDSLSSQLPQLLKGCRQVHFALGEYEENDRSLIQCMKRAHSAVRRGGRAPSRVVALSEVLHSMRLKKTQPELDAMRSAIRLTRDGHVAAMRAVAPGKHEYELEAVLRQAFLRGGSARPAYAPIVGSGPNATVLHHVRNQRQMHDGELVLIDAGAEYDYYAADITRTFPVSGRFSESQKRIYELVLAAQLSVISRVRPGVTLRALQDHTVEVLTEGLCELGIIAGPPQQAIEEGRHKPYYMHGVGHYLGMDVHDVGSYFEGDTPIPFEPGMVITVEPGLYFAPDKQEVPLEYRGIGVRIEDDVLVTEQGCEVLSAAIPKTVADIERLIRGA
jgi:Xaa-Pro aminopeptidase